jgi:tRNA-Thr(GGU) m(6)t(6)A37 methyltransferase TsaA
MSFSLSTVAVVHAKRTEVRDDEWGGSVAELRLVDGIPSDALLGLDAFSHIEVVYRFDRVADSAVVRGARHPRGNEAWPKVGIFAQRAKNRPNRLGVSIVRLVGVDVGERVVTVAELDAIDGTPVVDIKPVMREFLPRGEVRQPAWATELMADYWK